MTIGSQGYGGIGMRRFLIVGFTMFLVVGTAQVSQARAPAYEYTSIDYPGALATQVKGVNNSGALVGSYSESVDVGDPDSRLHGFIFSKGEFRNIDQSDTVGTHPQAITESGTVAGFIGNYDQRCCASTHITGYVTEHEETTFLEHKGLNMFVTDGNDRGDVVGFSHNGSGQGPGFIWNNGEITEVDAQPGGSTYLLATSEPPVVIGGQGGGGHFSYRRGEIESLTFPESMSNVAVRGMNNRGDLVGAYTKANGAFSGFLLRQGVVTDINVPGMDGTVPYEISDNGLIAGEYYEDGVTHGFIATPH